MKRLITLTLVMVFLLGFMGGMAGANPDPPNWDISGSWLLDFAGGTANREFVDLEQDGDGNVSGHFWWINNDDDWEYGGTLNGYVSGNDLYLDYDRDPDPIPYTGVFEATINKYGMIGTFVASSGFSCNWSTAGSPQLLYQARVTGGGQILAESGVFHKNGRDINYKISFGGGSYIVNGEYWFDGLEVTFHNVSVAAIKGGKFVGESLTDMDFLGDGTVANYTVLGEFNGESGYKMIIRVQDSGEPGFEDNLRFELFEGTTKVYDSRESFDFPADSDYFGKNRTYLDRGNIKVEDLR